MDTADYQLRKSMWVCAVTDPRRWNALLIGILVLGIAWILASRIETPTAGAFAPPNPQIGFAAPDFSLDTLDCLADMVRGG